MGATGIDELKERLEEVMRSGDRRLAVSLVLAAVVSGAVTIPQVYAALGELLAALGDSWRRGTTEVWQEHVASALVRTVVEALYPTVAAVAPAPTRGTVVLACPENESHDLGLRMLSDRFELAGWRVRYLGADAPAGEIAAAAIDAGAGLIVLSVSTHYHRMRLRRTLAVLQEDAPGVRVAVGGPAFRGEDVREVAERPFDPEEFLGPEGGA